MAEKSVYSNENIMPQQMPISRYWTQIIQKRSSKWGNDRRNLKANVEKWKYFIPKIWSSFNFLRTYQNNPRTIVSYINKKEVVVLKCEQKIELVFLLLIVIQILLTIKLLLNLHCLVDVEKFLLKFSIMY